MSVKLQSFVDQLVIKQEPRGQLGRYFLQVERELSQRGLTITKATFPELADVFEINSSSGTGLVQNFDCRTRKIDEATAACFIGYMDHQPITTMAVGLYDFTGSSVRDEFESLRFLYGEAAEKWRDRVQFRVSAPSAASITGKVIYVGAFWVRPDFRGTGLPFLVPDIARYYALSQWLPEAEISIGKAAFSRPEIQACYKFEHHERNAALSRDGKVMAEGFFLWSSVTHLYRRLDKLLSQPSLLADENLGSGTQEHPVIKPFPKRDK